MPEGLSVFTLSVSPDRVKEKPLCALCELERSPAERICVNLRMQGLDDNIVYFVFFRNNYDRSIDVKNF